MAKYSKLIRGHKTKWQKRRKALKSLDFQRFLTCQNFSSAQSTEFVSH